ncbi:MAG: AMP-binding protein [Bacteroidota bacterium]
MKKESFVSFIEQSILSNWDKEALADYKGGTYRYSDVGEQMVKMHLAFEQTGLKKGDKVALVGKNSANWASAFLSVLAYGTVVVPILPDFKPEDMENIINHSDSLFLFSSDQIFETLNKEKLPNIKAVISLDDFRILHTHADFTTEGLKSRLEEEEAGRYPAGIKKEHLTAATLEDDDLAVISYTSGTTGFSKGVMIPHISLYGNIRFAHENMPLLPGDRIVSFLPLAHTYGCAFEFLFPFTLGCHITFLTKTPSPNIIIQAFKEIRPRLILAVPLVIEKIYKNKLLPVLNKPLISILLKVPLINLVLFGKFRKTLTETFGGNFKELVIGGAAFNPEAERFFRKIKFPFTVGYGMTECGPLIAYAGWKDARLGSSGRRVDALEIRISKEDPSQKVGEIQVKGTHVMKGYYKNPEATRLAIEDDGWMHTGDLGYLDKDGFVYITGRSKSMLLGASGQNIYPEEIEARINNLTYIMESLVISDKGKLVALVFPDDEAIKAAGLSKDELPGIYMTYRNDLNRSIPSYMNISEFRIVDREFEKTPKRSIKRFLYSGAN